MWEKKTGRTFRRVYVAEDAVLKMTAPHAWFFFLRRRHLRCIYCEM
jgi:hypothetical protein